MAANNRIAIKGEDMLTLNEKYLFKRVKLEPGNYHLEVVHRAHGDGFGSGPGGHSAVRRELECIPKKCAVNQLSGL
jgi:hypothetical protein